jgi:hypothetical protein
MTEKIDFEDSGDAMVSSLKCVVEIVDDMGGVLNLKQALAADSDAKV